LMNDPYKTLGISRSASMEEIKKAYRELAKKYHPDNYAGNELADLADEKMKEINQAYDAIVTERERGGGSDGAHWDGGTGGTGGSSPYVAVRQALMRNDLDGAERLLNAMGQRDAEWHFLTGTLYYRRGGYDQARSYVNQAVSMDPGNREYRQASARMDQGAGPFRQPQPAGYDSGCGGCDCCDCCTAMVCLDCLCGGCR